MYTYELPSEVRDWVDAQMNCEDIAMNFVIASATGKSPVKVSRSSVSALSLKKKNDWVRICSSIFKVTPRKKFKCPECVKVEISADERHMQARSNCVNEFVEVRVASPICQLWKSRCGVTILRCIVSLAGLWWDAAQNRRVSSRPGAVQRRLSRKAETFQRHWNFVITWWDLDFVSKWQLFQSSWSKTEFQVVMTSIFGFLDSLATRLYEDDVPTRHNQEVNVGSEFNPLKNLLKFTGRFDKNFGK